MKIKIREIGYEGKRLVAEAGRDPWFGETLMKTLPDLYDRGQKGLLDLTLSCIGETVRIEGSVDIGIRPVCARCAERFLMSLQVPVRRILTLRPAVVSREVDSPDSDADDVEFGYYEGEEIEIDPIYLEEFLLALPISFFCRPDCRGLCPRCGANLNEGPCGCAGRGPTVSGDTPKF